MNVLPPVLSDMIQRLLAAGHGVRAVAAEVGVAKNTVTRYRQLLLRHAAPRCPCGAPIGHNGFCAWRFARSPRRQALIRAWTPRGRKAARPIPFRLFDRVARAPELGPPRDVTAELMGDPRNRRGL